MFFVKAYRYPEVLFNDHVLAFYEKSGFAEVRILFVISTVTVPC